MCFLDIVLFTARPKLRFVGNSVSIQRSKIKNRQTDYDLASSASARLSSAQTEEKAARRKRRQKSGRSKKKGEGRHRHCAARKRMAASDQTSVLIVVMGVSGCGKSTLSERLAKTHDWPFLEADDFHSDANIAKMSSGTPLTDEDRIGWINDIAKAVSKRCEPVVVLACSALTPLVQSRLKEIPREILFLHLNTQSVDMSERLSKRNHFMPPALLASQYEALSVPEGAINIDAGLPLATMVDRVNDSLRTHIPPDKQPSTPGNF